MTWTMQTRAKAPRPFTIFNEFGNPIASTDDRDAAILMTAAPDMRLALGSVIQLQTIRDSLTTWGKGNSVPAQVLDDIIANHRAAIAKAFGQ